MQSWRSDRSKEDLRPEGGERKIFGRRVFNLISNTISSLSGRSHILPPLPPSRPSNCARDYKRARLDSWRAEYVVFRRPAVYPYGVLISGGMIFKTSFAPSATDGITLQPTSPPLETPRIYCVPQNSKCCTYFAREYRANK